MSNRRIVPYVLAIGLLVFLVAPMTFGANADRGGTKPASSDTPEYAVIQFTDPAVSTYNGGIPGYLKTKPDAGKHLNAHDPAPQAYANFLANSHANFRAWMHSNVAQVEVVAEYSYVLNGMAVQLNGVSPDTLKGGPGVRDVVVDWLYKPAMDVSVPLIHAPQVWATLGVDLSGTPDYGDLANIKVGVIDTGIIPGHPFIDSCRESNPVVHRGPYFSGIPFGTAIVFDHGTHVAGTIGGCKIAGDIPIGDVTIPLHAAIPGKATGFLSGVAPGVTLYDYNVFPGLGVGFYNLDGNAFSHDILEAVEQSVIDGMDVINLSLSGGVQGPHDLLSEGLNAAVDAGVVAAVAAGNAGPGIMTVGSPGNAANVIAAGAITDPHFVGIPVTYSGTSYGAVLGAFANFGSSFTSPTDFTTTTPATGCTTITNSVSGKIAVIDRGTCTFTTKIRNAETAGAIGVLMVQNIVGDPIAMGADGTTPVPTIPAAMLSRSDGGVLKTAGSGQLTIDGSTMSEYVTDGQDIIAGFSSRGPTPYTFLIKPDVSAPGVNVLSSIFVRNEDGTISFKYEFFQGTSMATPHTAGAAALVIAVHPGWTPAQVKSALVNTADRTVRGATASGALLKNPNDRGGGRINVWSATNAPATLYPASVSFGVFTGGAAVNGAMSVAFHDETGSGLTCALSTTIDVAGTNWVSVSPASLTVPAGGTASATVTLSGGSTVGTGFFYGDVVAACGTTTLRAPWFAAVQHGNGALNGNMHSTVSGVDEIPADMWAQLTGTTAYY